MFNKHRVAKSQFVMNIAMWDKEEKTESEDRDSSEEAHPAASEV